MKVKSSKTKKARIEIIPLIDVIMFLLATFVLFTLTMNKTQTIDIKLPQSTPPIDQKEKIEPDKIGLDSAGGFFLNKKQVTWEELVVYMTNQKRDKDDPKFIIQGEEGASFGPAVQLLDEARKLKINSMSIDTMAKKSLF